MPKEQPPLSPPIVAAPSSVRHRVLAGLTAIMLVFSGLTVYSIFLHRHTVDKLALINGSYLPLILGTSEISANQVVFNIFMDRLADDPNQSVTREWIDAARRFRPTTLRRLIALVSTTLGRDIPEEEALFLGEMRARLAEVDRRYLENERRFEHLYGLMATGRVDEARVSIESLKRIERLLNRVLAGIGEEVSRHITDLSEEAAREATRATLGLALLTLAGLLIASTLIVLTNRLLAPLKTLQEAVANVARGELRTHIDVARGDEIGALTAGFNRMTDALAERDQMLIRSERLATAGKMAAQVTHEIRNPLSSLGLNAELLEEELESQKSPAEARILLRAMQDEIERLTGITESYLRFARLPAPAPTFADLNATVESALDFMAGEIERGRVRISKRLADDLGPALFDRGQIRQALTNLVRNACEAMPDGGTLSVETRLAGDTMEIAVTDTGSGVPAEAADHIFESFFSTKSGGTGLGLPLVRQICLAHGGDVRLATTGPDGSTFVLSLPGPGSAAKTEKGTTA